VRKLLMRRIDISRTEDSRCAPLAGSASNRSKLILRAIGVTVAMTVSLCSHAASLGAINVVSALGQPLKAEIELSDVRPEDELVAHIASPEAYKAGGLTYPSGVQYLIDIASRANGEPYLQISSDHDITESFVSLLVELSWPSGRLTREYSFLLDPPGYVATQADAAEAQINAPVMPGNKLENPPLTQSASAIEIHTIPAEYVEESAAPKQASIDKSEQATTRIVKSGDVLQKIAAESKPVDVSLQRMLVALYRANADRFNGQNMNRIKAGEILRMPDSEEIDKVTQTEAVADIQAHEADWNVYRKKLADAASVHHEIETNRQVATGKITAPVADTPPVANESPGEVLRLSRGSAPGSPLIGRSVKKNADAEDVIVKAKAVEEEKMRVVLLKKNMEDMQRLLKLKSEDAALIASAEKSASSVPASGVAVIPVAATVKPAVQASVSWTAQLKSYLLPGAAVLLGGSGFAFIRRKTAKVKQTSVAASNTTVVEPPELTPVESSMGELTTPPAKQVIVHENEVDPVSEAKLLLSFGQADALAQTLSPVQAQNNQSTEAETAPDKLAVDLTEPAEKTARLLPDQTVGVTVTETVEAAPLSSGESAILNAAAKKEPVLPGPDDLIFAVSGTDQPKVDSSVQKPLEKVTGMEHIGDFLPDDIKAKQSSPVISLADTKRDMAEVHTPADKEVIAEKSDQWHEVATKLNLAKAYQEMGDEAESREILDEVVQEGDAAQKKEAQLLIMQLS